MPCSSVKSLFEICLEYVKSHIGEISRFYQRPSIANSVSELGDSESPFDFLAPVVLEEICKDLARKNELKGKTLELLITPSLHSLNLSNSILGSHSIPYFLSLALKKCPHLKCLRLGGFAYFVNNHYHLLKLTHLKVLDIGGFRTSHGLLPLIAKYCQDLRVLHINDSAVSDTDIQCLVEECKALRMLNVLKTKVTRIGVLDATMPLIICQR